ncbi:DUF5058 family protein [Tissierella sp. MSJ-40]|uniref:DUF5058 family protein n=1 Tax=Tissierella simiarum TaxID=2841534 RepID=A0ABS6E724_9FIRM|nr:DUF5058 family protein [Tissierella simiarum]MBU5438707.1 DUF5058 family protein [Tissierella simiarum]
MNYLEVANHPLMWTAAALAVGVVILQSIIFAKKSYKTGKDIGLTEQQMKSAMKTSAISSIGPSMVILAGMVSLIVTMGGPIAWMRLSFIGSVTYELMAAGFGADAMGVVLGKEGMTEVVFANGVWTMILGSMGWLLFTFLFTHKMDKLTKVLANGKKAMVPIISAGAMLGAFAYFNADRILGFDAGALACISGLVLMMIIVYIQKKKNITWLREWGLTIAMFGGMLIGSLI